MSRNSFINTHTISSRWRDIEPCTDATTDNRNSDDNNRNSDDNNRMRNNTRSSYPGGRFMAFTKPKAPTPPKEFDLDKMEDEFPILE